MDAIITHEFADFDALAAAVAAQRLYAGAVIVLGQGVSAPVRAFLALHKDRFPHLRANQLVEDDVSRLIVVDVRRASRLQAFPRLLERIHAQDASLVVHVWDHHPAADDDVPARELHCAEIGSATTLLVEELRRHGVTIDVMEATLFALGIHADTGSLVFATSTARDAAALAWLMERGANARAIERYLDPPLSLLQRRALVRALERTRVQSVAGFAVAWCAIQAQERCAGLDAVASRARALLGVFALILAYEVDGKRTDVIARAVTPFIDVGRLLAAVGGGGYPSAASASAPGLSASDALARVEAALLEHPPQPRRVTDILSAPVNVVSPQMRLSDLTAALAAWEHTGVPVVDGDRLVGIVSRRDVEKAEAQAALHLPVGGWMTQNVHTIGPDASLEEALEKMQRHDVGRLPVMSGERLLGIVTRSDLLRVLYGDENGAVS